MVGLFVLVALLFALVIPLLLWLEIDRETSNPSVVDRSEAERLAREQGGRNDSRPASDDRTNGRSTDDGSDDHGSEPEWGTQNGSDERWGSRSDDTERDDR